MSSPHTAHLHGLQYLRGLGAIVCAGFHAAAYLHIPREITPFGVEIFFVISGFVSALAVSRLDASQSPWTKVRWILAGTGLRLLPLYWLSLVFACWPWISAWVASADSVRGLYWNFNPRMQGFLSDFLLVPRPNPDFDGRWWPQNVPGWTLNLQLWLSCVFALSLLAGRHHLRIIAAILGGAVLGAALWPAAPGWLKFYGQPMSLAFLAGLGLFELYRRRAPSSLATVPFLLATAAATLLFYLAGRTGFSLALTGVSMLGTWLFLRAPAAELRWARLLGDASYPIYLFHSVLGFPLATWALLASSGFHAADLAAAPDWQRAGAVVWLITVSVASGVAVHYVLERPLLGWIGRHWRRQRGGRSVEMNAASTKVVANSRTASRTSSQARGSPIASRSRRDSGSRISAWIFTRSK